MSRLGAFPLGSEVHVYPLTVFLQQVGESSDLRSNPQFACLLISIGNVSVCVFGVRVKRFSPRSR